jgi:hypothetical protein
MVRRDGTKRNLPDRALCLLGYLASSIIVSSHRTQTTSRSANIISAPEVLT